MKISDIVEARFRSSLDVKQKSLALLKEDLAKAAEIMLASLKSGGTMLTAGNGGSAADAQHMAAELVGRFLMERPGIPAVALTANSSTITCLVNDYPPEMLFSRQVEACGRAGDVLIGFSTSGNSKNVVEAMKTARSMDMKTIAVTGEGGGEMGRQADVTLAVPSRETPRIQEVHVLILHVLCEIIETGMYGR
ncbi:MAG TPA: SIS domain-containing protein [Planctomycetes bacterium]|nr:SIS domain-containing protein [Planctomycetota bacterium]